MTEHHARPPTRGPAPARGGKGACTTSPHAIFTECPLCGGTMAPEHAHYRCRACGWRDSCCD